MSSGVSFVATIHIVGNLCALSGKQVKLTHLPVTICINAAEGANVLLDFPSVRCECFCCNVFSQFFLL